MQKRTENQITALYCRLSQDDGVDMESNSIQNQRKILQEYIDKNRIRNTMFFADDGYSGTDFNRPDFQRMEAMVERGEIGTIIVKDLSRFARNYIEAGNYIEVKYPSMGVRFIAIQENIDTAEGTGIEMMPFYNIFNEWHAAQTSKKVREVFRVKAAEGKRVVQHVPYGYLRSKNDPDQWVVDEYASSIVRYIFDLCLQGYGTGQIAKRLQNEKVLTPTCYFASKGIKVSRTPQENPYRWCARTISNMFCNLEYTGCAVNFKSTFVSYKVHKRVFNPKGEWQIIPNAQEPIIDEETFQRVQEIRSHRRRITSTGRTSIFTSKMFCGDCGAKMYFCAAKSIPTDKEFFRCSEYKENRGKCSIHYIRESVVREIVTEAVKRVAEYVTHYEPVFLYLYAKQNSELTMSNIRKVKQRLEASEKRIDILNRLIMKVFEEHTLGEIPDDRYQMMTTNYEREQRELRRQIETDNLVLQNAEQNTVDLKVFLNAIRKCTDIAELDEKLVNTLISKIEVFKKERVDGKYHVPIKIHFTAVDIIDVPTEKEILSLMEEIRNSAKTSKTA